MRKHFTKHLHSSLISMVATNSTNQTRQFFVRLGYRSVIVRVSWRPQRKYRSILTVGSLFLSHLILKPAVGCPGRFLLVEKRGEHSVSLIRTQCYNIFTVVIYECSCLSKVGLIKLI